MNELDMIIEDIALFEQKFQQLKNENQLLSELVDELKLDNALLRENEAKTKEIFSQITQHMSAIEANA